MRRTKQAKDADFASALKTARGRARLTQGQLARRLKIGQQTVSKWEHGVIVPSHDAVGQLLRVLPKDEAALREALQRDRRTEKPEPAAKSVAALTTTLNLDHLTPDQFQAFCADLFQSIYPPAAVNIYGTSGDPQDGLDIEIRFPEGYRYTAQCKRVKNFGPRKIADAVRTHRASAKKKFLVITRVATRQTRDAAKKFEKQGWHFWDIEDISRQVRLLTSDRARALVDAYAPGQRKEFLGIEHPSPFSAPETFFRQLLRQEAIFSHAWALVGRSSELTELADALRASVTCITVVGAGGSGKSRLVLEFLRRVSAAEPHRTLRVLAPGAAVIASDIERYKDSRGVFLIEDAHDRDDLEPIVSLFGQFAPDATLLLTTRPYGVQNLEAILVRHGRMEQSRLVRLRDLARTDLAGLAREILTARAFRPDLAEDIARVADRSPLFAVIASNLVAEKRLHPRVLANEDVFKRQVFAHFQDVLTQSIAADSGEKARVHELLNLAAVLQPVDVNGAEFRASAEAIYKRPSVEYDRVKQLLLDASVLVARGGRSRIVPDMLADYILEQACATSAGRSATFSERVLSGLQPGQLRNVLHNLAKLDWRLSAKQGLTARASIQIWAAIEALYRDREGAREGILEAVESAAYYLPGQALAFLEKVEVDADSDRGSMRVDRIGRIIRNAAYHQEYVREAAERLWERGRDRPARLNSEPDHPVRLLQGLAAIEVDKPVTYIADVVEFALELLDRADAADYAWSPFDILESVLATEGHTTTSTGRAIQIGHFTVNIKTLSPLRAKVLAAAFRFIENPDLRLSIRAVRTIGSALRYPMRGGANERAPLDEEFLHTFRRLEQVVRKGTLDPLLATEIVKVVGWHAGFASGPTRDAARAVAEAVPHSLLQDLTECMVEGWGHHRWKETDDATGRIEAWREHQRTVGRTLRQSLGSVDKVLEALGERLRVFNSAGSVFHGEPHIFMRLLCEDWPELANEILARTLKDSGDPISNHAEQALGALVLTRASERTSLGRALLNTGNVDLRRRVAVAYGYSLRGTTRLESEDVEMLRTLLADGDQFTVIHVIHALSTVVASNPSVGKQLFFETNICSSEKVADELAAVFCNSEELRKTLTPDDIRRALSRIVDSTEMEGHWVQDMVGTLSESHPELALDFLLTRVKRAAADPKLRYRAIPFHWQEGSRLRFRQSGYLVPAMTRIMDFARESQQAKVRDSFSINQLFMAAVVVFDKEVREFLSTYLSTADQYGVAAVGQVLSEAPGDFLFGDLEFSENLLRLAARYGRKVKDGVQFGLYRATTTGLRSGTPGEPFPQDVALKKQAEEALSRIPANSPARQLLTWVRDHAQRDIERTIVDGELLDDEG